MPKLSSKFKAIDFLVLNCAQEIIELDYDCDEEIEDEILDRTVSDLMVVFSMRYCTPFTIGSVPKSRDWWLTVLPALDNDRFKIFTRVTRQQFSYILREISQDPLFTGAHSIKQLPLELQLAVFLYRLGCSGEGGSIAKIAALFGIGDGGTVEKVSRRVMQAILNKKTKFLFWPNEEERKELVLETFNELPYCFGYVDGSEAELAEKPARDWESFYSRKQNYSIKAQVTCDHKLRVRHLVVGAPGSVHDARIFSNSALGLHPEKYFSGMQWLAADTAYRLTSTVLTPFKKPRGGLLDSRDTKFNKIFSSYRVRVEHCFGVIKERFNSLRELKIQIKECSSISYACLWITVACILHNMLIEVSDDNDLEELLSLVQLQAPRVNDDEEEEVGDEIDDTPGVRKRRALMQILLDSP